MTEERIISILKHLNERVGKPVTSKKLSDELRVSVKTIHNDLVVLKGTSNNYQLIHLKMKLEKNTEN
ncbi:HTH domain-containing protein [Lactococcus laudensis]|uniref:HTH domain-containing protein n=1 Tax=Pseudolactococcus laudensis TaxID=1494461 RepID=UPI002FC9075A